MKTSKLTGAALDWAVAKCEGENSIASCYYADDNTPLYLDEAPQPEWKPSTDWVQAGPIIERERISVYPIDGEAWAADDNLTPRSEGPTPLLAAMRCYVASKLGDYIELPEGLTN